MPKVPAYTLAWLPARETYELYQTREREALAIVPDTPAWFAWLEQVSSFAFAGQGGHFTARKEARQRGDRYWAAYLTTGQRLSKKYLGKSADLSLAQLERIAGLLSVSQASSVEQEQEEPFQPACSAAPTPPSNSQVAAGTGGQVETAQPPFLETKLYVPRPRIPLVPRTRLIERLQQGVERAFTLVSAPAGFGKTTVLAQWLAQSAMPVAWLSLEAEDNDPTRFFSYLIAALQTHDARLGTSALALLRTPQPASPEVVLTTLTNDLVERGGGDVVLVLDDYHVIRTESIQRGMTFLLEHRPPQLHLVVATRADPPLPLARLRAQGQLTEVRTADLRFGAVEVDTFLQAVMGLDLPAEAILTLESRTEGWIAGLQLAALSLQGRSDVPAFLAAFSGSHRYVLDYLSDEVLARQDAAVQQFLLHTSVLERLRGPLCDAVTGLEGGQALLEGLERANLFVVSLDNERGWYRYHHLFAEVLRRHLQQREPSASPELHRRASAWYEQHGLPAEAVQHALAAPHFERAARLIEAIALPVAYQGQISTVLGWMNALPEALVRTRPFLRIYHASLLLFTNRLEESAARLREVEQDMQTEVPASQAQIIKGWVFALRGSIALFYGDIPQAIPLEKQALELLPEAEVIPRAGAMAAAIRAYLVSGDATRDTEQAVAAAVASIRSSGNLFSTVSSLSLLARLHVLQGRLRDAAAAYAQVTQVVPRLEVLQTAFSSLIYYFGLGDLLCERNDLDAAHHQLMHGMALITETLTVEPFVVVLGYTALARVQQARGDFREARAALDALARVAERRDFPSHLLIQVAAARAHRELEQGNMAAAIHWAESSGLSAEDDDPVYPLEAAYLTLARVRIAQARNDPTAPFLPHMLGLLERLRREAEAKARLGSALAILVLRVLALEAQGDRPAALSTLERALVLAAPEGYIRLFVDEGEPMLTLLRLAYARGILPAYVATLLSAFGEQDLSALPLPVARPSPLAEALTQREREVLGLLLEGASNREIARRLVLSVNTVKRHVYNLSGKLGVQSRAQAIARARQLDLL